MNKANRLQKFIEHKGLTVNVFEKSIGTRSTIAKFLSKDSNLGIHWISRIIEVYPDFNVHWFFTGNGEMIKSNKFGTDDISSISDSEIIEHIAQDLERFKSLATFRRVVGLKD